LAGVGIVGAGTILGCSKSAVHANGAGQSSQTVLTGMPPKSPTSKLYPADRNDKYKLDRPLSAEDVAGKFNNFYEFTETKDAVWRMVDRFTTRPWEIEVNGSVHKPATFDIDDLVRKFPLEERLYRFRCVETWAMAVPWTGFPMKALMDAVQPKSSTTHVRFVTALDKQQMPNTSNSYYRWPYYEGLTIEEAANELTMLATGIYGHELPKQHGAPIRLVVPWKYGFKNIKSIVKIEFLDKEPATFWNDLAPTEYKFTANVEPNVPHPRWSQASEWMIDTKERRPTQMYNGYGDYVAKLYA
jgi:sulfoxide reductase catalytic subunit YedY